MLSRRNIVLVVAFVCVIVLSGGIAYLVGRDGGSDAGSRVDNSSAAPETTMGIDSGSEASSGENYPGAMLGNTQRTWPDPAGLFDDSRHATPGTYSVDPFFQRPVWTPINHDGDFPSSTSDGGWDQCKDPGAISLAGKTQQQYVNARYLIVNDQAGPTRLERGVPRGYAHSPQGAVVAAMNLGAYGVMRQGDEVGEEIDKELWQSLASYQEAHARRKVEWTKERMQESRAGVVPAITHYRIQTCSEQAMVVDVSVFFPKLKDQQEAIRMPLFWRDGDWQPDFTGVKRSQETVNINDINEYVEVMYS